MPKKHPRRDSDIEQLGRELSSRWQPADGIEPWLRSIEPALSHKVRHDRWSWEGIARGLNAAGIVYETGRPWTGASLTQKITSIRYEARQPGSGRRLPPGDPVAREVSPALPIAPPPPPAQSAGAPSVPTDVPAEEDEPEFRPASLKGWSGTRIVRPGEPPPEPKPSTAPPPAGDAGAVIARLLGKTSPQTRKD